jgi:hypothetical protein
MIIIHKFEFIRNRMSVRSLRTFLRVLSGLIRDLMTGLISLCLSMEHCFANYLYAG